MLVIWTSNFFTLYCLRGVIGTVNFCALFQATIIYFWIGYYVCYHVKKAFMLWKLTSVLLYWDLRLWNVLLLTRYCSLSRMSEKICSHFMNLKHCGLVHCLSNTSLFGATNILQYFLSLSTSRIGFILLRNLYKY